MGIGLGGGNQQSGGNFWSGLGSTFLGMLPGLGSMIGGHQNERRDYRNRRNLTEYEYQLQRLLNQQGHDLQYDMWRKTNYPAQIQMMKSAGLNPGLMYGMSGGGGTTTGSQSGGSVSSASSGGQMQPMDVTNMMKVLAEIKNINSSTDVNKATEKDILETLPGDVKKLEKEANNLVASTNELGSREQLNIANEGLAKANIKLVGKQKEKIDAEILKIVKDKELVQKIITMDYSEDYGRNQMLNLTKMLKLTPDEGGGLGWDDAGKLGVVAGTIYLLRANLTRTGMTQGYNAVKGKLNQIWTWVKRKRAGSLRQRY
jgi:hypothetical protein